MIYTGIECCGCGKEFTENDDVVVCPECGSPQHRECWMRDVRCVNYSLHSEGFAWSAPEWKIKMDEQQRLREDEEKRRRAETRNDDDMMDDILSEIEFKNGEKSVKCPKCGSLNFSNDAVCSACGTELKRGYTREGDGFDRFEYVRLYGGVSSDTEIDGIPVAEISQYIGGRNPGKFIRRFAMMDRSGKRFSINPAVILFGPLWYFYRRMPKIGALLLAASLVVSLIGTFASLDNISVAYCKEVGGVFDEVLAGEISIDEYTNRVNEIGEKYSDYDTDTWRTAVGYICEILSVGIFVFTVFRADTFYRKKVRADVLHIRPRNTNMQDYMADLSESGGTSALCAVAGVLLAGLLRVAAEIPVYYIMFFG